MSVPPLPLSATCLNTMHWCTIGCNTIQSEVCNYYSSLYWKPKRLHCQSVRICIICLALQVCYTRVAECNDNDWLPKPVLPTTCSIGRATCGKQCNAIWPMQCVIHNVHCVIHKHHEPLQCAICDVQATALCNRIHYCTPPHQKSISSVKKHNITQCTLCTEMIVKSIISPRSAAVPNLTQRRLSFKQRSYSPSAVRNL